MAPATWLPHNGHLLFVTTIFTPGFDQRLQYRKLSAGMLNGSMSIVAFTILGPQRIDSGFRVALVQHVIAHKGVQAGDVFDGDRFVNRSGAFGLPPKPRALRAAAILYLIEPADQALGIRGKLDDVAVISAANTNEVIFTTPAVHVVTGVMADSRWTLTVLGDLLQRHGAKTVHPFVIATTNTSD
jgi:hypothetical protein